MVIQITRLIYFISPLFAEHLFEIHVKFNQIVIASVDIKKNFHVGFCQTGFMSFG